MLEKEIAVGIAVLVYALMLSEKVHRTVAVLLGAVMMVGLGVLGQNSIVGYIHWEALGLIFGMFIIVAALSETGFFRWVGLHALKATRFDPTRVFVLFSLLAALLAAFMDSITVLIFMAALTMEVCRVLDVPPFPIFLSVICSANIGGAATMVGDPPNVIIGTNLGLSFADFLAHVGPIAAVLFAANTAFLWFYFRKVLARKGLDAGRVYREHADLEPFSAVRDLARMRVTLAVFAFTVTLLVMHKYLDIMVATVAIAGATVVLLAGGEKAWELVDKIDWHTIVFLAGLFVVIGGLDSVGVLSDFADGLVSLSGGNHVLIVTLMLWAMAPISALTDNVPFAAAMLPVVKKIAASTGLGLTTLAWTLAVVSDVSGNATPIGASANVVGMSVAKKNGVHVSWKEYCRAAFPATIICIAVANVMLVALFLL